MSKICINVNTRKTFISKVFNSKNIYLIVENCSTVLTQFKKKDKYNIF